MADANGSLPQIRKPSELLTLNEYELFHRFTVMEKVASQTSHYPTVKYSCHLLPERNCSFVCQGKDAAHIMKKHMAKHKKNLKNSRKSGILDGKYT